MGWLLALGLAARSGPLVRCLAAGSTVIFALALYFTYSRASWIALVLRARGRDRARHATAAADHDRPSCSPLVDHRGRGRLDVARADAPERGLSRGHRDGHGLAVIAIGLVVAASLTILVVDWLASAVSVPYRVRRMYAGTLLFLLAASC